MSERFHIGFDFFAVYRSRCNAFFYTFCSGITCSFAYGAHILDMLHNVKPANPANEDIVLPEDK